MTSQDDQPAYRWVIVFASALILSIAMGSIVNGMAAYVVPMQEVHGWKRGDVSLINFSGIMGLALGGLIMGTLADRLGTRPVVLFGVSILGLCYVAASWVTVLWQLYALFFVAGFLGAGAIYPPIMAAVGNWFSTGAGLAIGIAAAGQALGQGGVPFASSHLIEAFGIDGALRLTGLFMLVAMIPLAALLSQPPALAAATMPNHALANPGWIWFAAAVGSANPGRRASLNDYRNGERTCVSFASRPRNSPSGASGFSTLSATRLSRCLRGRTTPRP